MSNKPLVGNCIIGQSGGPSSVINASAYGVIKTALESEYIPVVYGANHGIRGVLDDRLMIMNEEDPEELARALDLPLAAVCEAMDAVAAPVSLYEPIHSDSGDALLVMDQISDPRCSDERWLEDMALRDALETLGEREKRILFLRYYDDKTQVEVAKAIGISQAQVSRLEKGALKRLKQAIVS